MAAPRAVVPEGLLDLVENCSTSSIEPLYQNGRGSFFWDKVIDLPTPADELMRHIPF